MNINPELHAKLKEISKQVALKNKELYERLKHD